MNPTSIESLQKLASMSPSKVRSNGAGAKGGNSPPPNGDVLDQAAEAWARAAFDDELAILGAAQLNNRNNQLNKSAFALGQIAGAGLLDQREVESALERKARNIGLDDSEIGSTIRSGLAAGMDEPRYPPETPRIRNTKGRNEIHSGALSVKSAISPDDWPDPPGEAAFSGLAGEFVTLADRYTEADRVAMLAHFLTAFGCAVGKGPHAAVGATRHDARLNIAIVGRTGKARKGDSWQPVRAIFQRADPDFVDYRVQSGLASGEGLIHAVRNGTEGGDLGISDKRLLVIEPEFSRLLTAKSRQGNTLSPIIRDAWDRGDLQTITKTSPAKATGAHIGVVGHITMDELKRELTDTDVANGFANRFIFFCVKRSKELPEPDVFEGPQVERMAHEVAQRIEWARGVGYMARDEEARELWKGAYHDLSAERDGLVGSILARAEAQVLRLSLIYALLDGSEVVRMPHLQSALALWEYSERCADYIFGDATGDHVADMIYSSLKQRGPMTRTEIYGLFAKHVSSARIGTALALLLEKGKVKVSAAETGGRPVEVWESAQ